MEDCTDIVWEGYDEFDVPTPRLNPPTGGDQTANVVITGDSSGITIANAYITSGAGMFQADTRRLTNKEYAVMIALKLQSWRGSEVVHVVSVTIEVCRIPAKR